MGTDQAWQKWGQSDPYFGVLTHEQFRADAIAANRDEFFATGERDVEAIVARYTRCFGAAPMSSVLDFGCGVGRLALAFARRCDDVLGLDISEAMLAEARANAGRLSVGNARFALSDDRLSAAQGEYDFVNSLIVLQHIPVARGMPIIAQLLDHVRPGGGCMIHVATRRQARGVRRLAYRIRHNVPLGNAAVNLATGKPARQPAMQMNEYPMPEVLRLFAERGMSEVVATIGVHDSVQTVALCARREA